jgi:hypothetical protein
LPKVHPDECSPTECRCFIGKAKAIVLPDEQEAKKRAEELSRKIKKATENAGSSKLRFGNKQETHPNIGSSFDEFLGEEGGE